MVVARMLRLAGHGEHDDASYVPTDLREGPLGRDCVEVGEAQLIARAFATAEEIVVWREEVTDEIQRALAKAQQEPKPDPWHENWDARSTNISMNS